MHCPRRVRASLLVLAAPVVVVLWNAAHDTLALESGGARALLLDASAMAALFALLAVAGASLSRAALRERLGLRRGRFGAREMAIGAIGLLALSHAVEGLLTLLGVSASPSLARFSAALGGATPGELALALVILALGSAGAEELFFRGLVQRGLERSIGAVGAIGIAALAFGAAHADAVRAAAAVPLGVYLGALAWRDGSIRPALLAHAVNNAVAVLEAGLGLRLPEGRPAALAAIGVGLAIAGLGWWAVARGAASLAPASAPPAVPSA